jgi:hypothetical protein
VSHLKPGAATLVSTLLAAEAAIEGMTGVALILASGTVVWLLFDAAISDIGTVVARICGIALFSLASACWVGRGGSGGASALAAMLIYNVLAAAYLALLGLQGEFVGLLLWPVILLHAAMGLLVAIAWRRNG